MGLETSLFPEQPGSTESWKQKLGPWAPAHAAAPGLLLCPPWLQFPRGLWGGLLPGVGGEGKWPERASPSARHFFFYVKVKGGEPPQMEARGAALGPQLCQTWNRLPPGLILLLSSVFILFLTNC